MPTIRQGTIRSLAFLVSALFALGVAGKASACALCYDAVRELVTIGLQLDVADRVVLAEPIPKTKQLRIVEVVKGNDRIGDTILDAATGAATRTGGHTGGCASAAAARHSFYALGDFRGASGRLRSVVAQSHGHLNDPWQAPKAGLAANHSDALRPQ
jgi:hypothetical protein